MCCSDYPSVQKLGFATVRDGLRWHLIEKSPGKYRLVELAADAGGGGAGRDAGDLGPVPLRLARLRRPGRARLSRALHRLRARRARGCSSRSATGRRLFVRSTRSISCPGQWTMAISRRSGPHERGWFKQQLVKGGDHRVKGNQAALARRDDHLGRAPDPHRPARSAPPTVRGAEREPPGHVRGL